MRQAVVKHDALACVNSTLGCTSVSAMRAAGTGWVRLIACELEVALDGRALP